MGFEAGLETFNCGRVANIRLWLWNNLGYETIFSPIWVGKLVHNLGPATEAALSPALSVFLGITRFRP